MLPTIETPDGMIVRLWNRDLRVSSQQQQVLTDYILLKLTKAKDERESVSHLIREIRWDTGLQFPTRMIDAETMFEALGFTLVREKNKQGATLRTYVTV